MCPICSGVFLVDTGGGEEELRIEGLEIDAFIDGHISRGCPSSEGLRPSLIRCGKDGCKTKSPDPVVCPLCQRGFCMDHRLEFNHECDRNQQLLARTKATLSSRRKRKCSIM